MNKILRPHGKSKFVIFCDHASNHIPAELNNLGLPPAELERHIAYDIGAAGVTEELSRILDATAVLCDTSRLVIDCNRQLNAYDLIPEVSDGTVIPGNQNLSASDRERRIKQYFEPYHAAVESVIEKGTIAISIHSMTPIMAGVARPWPIAFSSHEDRTLVEPLLKRFPEAGDNQPYDLDPAVDYSTPYHAIRRKMLHLQVEFRQDEVATPEGQIRWARRFGESLALR
jgi:predicted N-formylglutamate amidohydrolase